VRTAALFYACLLYPAFAFSQSAGVPAEWEIRKTMTALVDEAGRLKAAIDQIQPSEWVEKGAPDAYVKQHGAIQAETKYLEGATRQLARQPEKLSIALETLFRLQALESLTLSLAEGVERYQNPSLASLIRGLLGANAANRDKLRQYVVDLASTKEAEYSVLEKEAQRCRGTLSRQGPQRQAAPPVKKQEKK